MELNLAMNAKAELLVSITVSKKKGTRIACASIYRLGMKKHHESFAPDEFDLIVVGEFHHAAGPAAVCKREGIIKRKEYLASTPFVGRTESCMDSRNMVKLSSVMKT